MLQIAILFDRADDAAILDRRIIGVIHLKILKLNGSLYKIAFRK